MNLVVNFNAGTFDGKLSLFKNTVESWDVWFDGGLGTQGLSINNYKASNYWDGSTNVSFTSDIQLAITGAGAEGVAAIFDFQTTDPSIYAQGVVVADQDLRLSGVETLEMINYVGFYTTGSNFSAVAHASSGDGGSVPVFGISGQQFGSKNFASPTFGGVYKKSAGTTQTSPVTAKQISGDTAYTVNLISNSLN